VLVVEAPEVSGALRTAGNAANLNRMVFVVPGNFSLTNFRGSHALIRDGAMLVDHPDQIVETLGIEAAEQATVSPVELPEHQRAIIQVLGDDPISSEVIVDRTGLDVAVVSSELTLLELEGLILRDGIGYARKP
jgi:DNA processing protein